MKGRYIIVKQESALENKFKKIEKELRGQATFYTEDIYAVFPDMKKSSLYWNLSKLVEAGYLKRIRNGVYAFNEWKGKNKISLSTDAEKISNVLDELGFQYYVSGTDVLHKYMQHVPEQYPIILFVEKAAREEVENALRGAVFQVIEPTRLKERYEDSILSGNQKTQIVLYVTDNFDNSKDGIATIEKAFVDLYFSITRNGYPIAVQELVRIYMNLSRLGNIDKKKMISAAAKRNIQYDIRFIAESKYITNDAMRFVEILKSNQGDNK